MEILDDDKDSLISSFSGFFVLLSHYIRTGMIKVSLLWTWSSDVSSLVSKWIWEKFHIVKSNSCHCPMAVLREFTYLKRAHIESKSFKKALFWYKAQVY